VNERKKFCDNLLSVSLRVKTQDETFYTPCRNNLIGAILNLYFRRKHSDVWAPRNYPERKNPESDTFNT
jgi:hypothetical protein